MTKIFINIVRIIQYIYHLTAFRLVEGTGKLAVLVGVGGAGQEAGVEAGLGAAVAMLGRDGDYFTPGTQGVIRFSQIDRSRYGINGSNLKSERKLDFYNKHKK